MPEEHGPLVPELARRATVSSCRHDPARALVPVLTAMPADRASRSATCSPTPATPTATPAPGPCRCAQAGAQLIQDLHPHDRGPKGTHHGAVIANGNLYCPATPRTLLELGPLARGATSEQAAAHDAQDRRDRPLQARPPHPRRRRRLPPRRLPRGHGQDPLPAAPASMTLDRDRPGDPPAPRASPGLLHPADPHRPARGHREDRPETRLPVRGLAPLLRPPHRRRTRLRHRQGPRQQRHQPRLVPPDGPGTRSCCSPPPC